jgi:3-deoxy-7-phosphoheptulonate synthase
MKTEPMTLFQNTPDSQTRPVLASREISYGGQDVVLMAGPCAVESYDQFYTIASALNDLGVRVLRGGAFKPRTSPHSFQGLGTEGLEIMRTVADEFGMLVISEALGVENLPDVMDKVDIIQIGSRNMQHYPLLWAVGETNKPVMLKRGYMSRIEEWLAAAEHISSRGNTNILLCERGVRGFDPLTRNILDTSAIALAKQLSPYPVIGDPSHATGRTDLVLPAARAAVAAGADGLIIETHPEPRRALSDGDQAIPLSEFAALMDSVRAVAGALGRGLT